MGYIANHLIGRSYVDHVASYKQGISREIAALRH